VLRVLVPAARPALARLAAAFWGHPSRALTVVGITGTNGKTTTSYLVEALLRARGGRTGVIGTIQYRVGDETMPAAQTTPEAVELQGLLARIRKIDPGYAPKVTVAAAGNSALAANEKPADPAPITARSKLFLRSPPAQHSLRPVKPWAGARRRWSLAPQRPACSAARPISQPRLRRATGSQAPLPWREKAGESRAARRDVPAQPAARQASGAPVR